MDVKQTWETPEFEPITESDVRADQVDIPVRNGLGQGSVPN